MDHLPWRYTDRPRPVVPNFCAHLGESDLCPDYESFFDWPHTQEWNINSDTEFSSLATYCQSWLFLGLAKVVAGRRRLSNAIFGLIPSEDPNVLDTREITKKFLHVRWSYEQSSDVAQLLDFAQLQMLEWFAIVESNKTRENAWTEDTFDAFWSTALFHEGLRRELREEHKNHLHGTEVAEYINSQTFILDRIRLTGRCTTALRRKQPCLLDTWVLLSTPLPHSLEVEQALLHNTCTGRDCKAFHIDKDSYKMQHAVRCKPGANCRLSGIPAGHLKTIIEAGLFPVVRSTVDHRTGLHIDIVDGDDVGEFTAISHVWAGGLGNFNDNTVYECQLESLHLALSPSKTIRSTVYYWLDTLCIPVDDPAVRKKAIDDMARIYASARSVYVLDPIIQHIDVGRLTYREQAVLIAASPWMARSWTFQEAGLAVQINFQFRDAVSRFGEVALPDGPLASSQLQILWHRDVDRLDGGELFSMASPKWQLANIYAFLVWARLIPFRLRSHTILRMAEEIPTAESITPEESLLSVWQELSQRSSKELQDVAAIIAVFIGRSAKEVLDLEPRERTHALLWSLKSLPVSLLFAPTSDNSTGSWCPMLPTCSTDNNDQLVSKSSLKFTDEGLLELTGSKELHVIHVTQPLYLESTRTVWLVLSLENDDFHVQLQVIFPEPSVSRGKQVAKAKHDIILILPRSSIYQETRKCTGRNYPGICAQLKPRGRRRSIHATYSSSFRWKVIRLERSTEWQGVPPITSKLKRYNNFLSPSDAVEALRQPDSSIKGEVATTLHLTDRGMLSLILLDMNIEDRKHLKWSRQIYYPFQGHSVETAKPLAVAVGLKVVGVSLYFGRIFVFLCTSFVELITGYVPQATCVIGQTVPAAAFLFPLAVLRVILGELEERHLRALFRFPLQRKWASSFKVTGTGNNAISMAQYPSLRKIWPLISIYCLFSLLALTLLPLQIKYFCQRLRYRSDQDWAAGSPLFAIFVTVFEFSAGGAVLPTDDPCKFDPRLAIVGPYLVLCLELALRNSYVLWVFVHNFHRPRTVDIVHTEDQQTDRFRTDNTQRHTWIEFGGLFVISVSASFCGLVFIVVCFGQRQGDVYRDLPTYLILLTIGIVLLLAGFWCALAAHESLMQRKCWLELKIRMFARGLRRLWSTNSAL